MSLLSKLRSPQARIPEPQPSNTRNSAQSQRVSPQAAAANPTSQRGRSSNGLKEFMWQLDDIGNGNLLDLGPVWQATVSFFTERCFKVYTEDLLGAWKAFLQVEEEEKARLLKAGQEPPNVSSDVRIEHFLAANLRHEPNTFDAVLMWDLLDYFDRDAVRRIAARLTDLVREGGAVLGVFHMRMPEQFHRYRVLDAQNFELVPTPMLIQPQRVYQNREIQELFEGFRSSKAFVRRDQLREGVFVK